MDFNNAPIIFGTAFRKDEKLSENKEKCIFQTCWLCFLRGGGGHSHIGSHQGCAARMGDFSKPKTCGWVSSFDQKPADGS